MKLEKLLAAAAMAAALGAGPAFAQDTQNTMPADQGASSTPPPTIDSNGDGTPDAWDTNGDGKADAWDTNGDGQPDQVDANGDGQPDQPQ